MILYILATITISYMYYYLNYFKTPYTNSNTTTVSEKYDMYVENKLNKGDKINKKINNNIRKKLYLLKWKNKITNINDEFYKNIFIKKNKENLIKIKNKDHLCFWAIDNNMNKLKNYNVIAFNFKTIYDYENEMVSDELFLSNISEYCHKNKLIFVIISEMSPLIFKDYQPKYFNKNNYYSPYNYKNKMFGSIQKLEINKHSTKPANITINRIILDIMNRYGCDQNNIIYIDNQKLSEVETLIIPDI